MRLVESYRYLTLSLKNLAIVTAVLFLLCQCIAVSSASDGFFIDTLPVNPAYTVTPTPIPFMMPGIIGDITLNNTTAYPGGAISILADGSFSTYSPLLYVANNNSISVIDTVNNEVIDTIDMGPVYIWSVAVSPDYTRLFVIYFELPYFNWGYHGYYTYIDTIDLRTKQVISSTRDINYGLQGGVNKMLLSKDGKSLYILLEDKQSGFLVEYDPYGNHFTRQLSLAYLYYNPGSQPVDMVLSHDGSRLYIADFWQNSVICVLTSTFKLDDSIPLSNGIIRFNLTGKGVSPKFVYPNGVAVSPDNSRVYVSNEVADVAVECKLSEHNYYYSSDYITVYEMFDIATKLAVSQDGGRLYVLEPGSRAVRGFDTVSKSEIRSYGTGKYPSDLAISPDGKRLYVSNSGSDTVTAIEIPAMTHSPGSPISVGYQPRSMAMGPVPSGPIFINKSSPKSPVISLPVAIKPVAGIAIYNITVSVSPTSSASPSGTPAIVIGPDMFKENAEIPIDTGIVDISGYHDQTALPTPIVPGTPSITPVPSPVTDASAVQGSTILPSSSPDTTGTPAPTATPGLNVIICIAALLFVTLLAAREKT
ncbi:YncE family protein [Methanooceanicella nereidis]|nr:YncE family protein [Methanocella sp. CWC-04]